MGSHRRRLRWRHLRCIGSAAWTWPAARVSLAYLLFGLLWIGSSDWLLGLWVQQPDLLVRIGAVKGWLFVLASALLIFGLLHRPEASLRALVARRTRELRQANDALAAARDEAQRASHAKSAFVASMSHEIRTPMNAILGLTWLMRRDAPDAAALGRLDRLDDAAGHLLQVVNDVLDLSKIEAGRMVLEQLPFSLAGTLQRCLAMVGGQARAKGLKLALHIDPVPDGLCGDATRLSQAVLNLLTNALKFTARGRVRLEVRLLAEEPTGVWLRFAVQDTGLGIPADKLDTLFQAFSQADTATARQFGGTGLGLAIVRRIAGLMGGEVGVRSEPGAGSEFWFTARLARAPAVASPDPAPRQVAARPPAGACELPAEAPLPALALRTLGELLEGGDLAAVALFERLRGPLQAAHGHEPLDAIDRCLRSDDVAGAARRVRALQAQAGDVQSRDSSTEKLPSPVATSTWPSPVSA